MDPSYIFTKKVFLIFREMKLFKKTSNISGNFPSSEKISNTSRNGTF